jgi:hypothetical protein
MKRFYFFLLVFLIGFSACEKVIDIPLNLVDESLVVEAVLKDGPGVNYVRLSKSGTVYDDDDFEVVSDAVVTVVDQLGEVTVFEHLGGGVYNAPDFEVVPGFNYQFSVEYEEVLFTSSCQTGLRPKIDSLTFDELPNYTGEEADVRYLVSFHAVDHPVEDNYYWVNIFRNGKRNSGYYLGNDDFIDGAYFNAAFFGASAKSGDTVMVEVQAIDQANYNYLFGLSNNIANSPFGAAPANPPTNLVGGALGFFGAYTTDSLTIIIP